MRWTGCKDLAYDSSFPLSNACLRVQVFTALLRVILPTRVGELILEAPGLQPKSRLTHHMLRGGWVGGFSVTLTYIWLWYTRYKINSVNLNITCVKNNRSKWRMYFFPVIREFTTMLFYNPSHSFAIQVGLFSADPRAFGSMTQF